MKSNDFLDQAAFNAQRETVSDPLFKESVR
ncbi:MAG: hypothetical protein QOG91_660 [Candidatus Parcubacteria bacterium]|jgi:hypothetical protein|nr:hypothetical protein [Candidatus Parcubacteria bacterium]